MEQRKGQPWWVIWGDFLEGRDRESQVYTRVRSKSGLHIWMAPHSDEFLDARQDEGQGKAGLGPLKQEASPHPQRSAVPTSLRLKSGSKMLSAASVPVNGNMERRHTYTQKP